MTRLIVCALESETDGRLAHEDVLYTGVGKVNSAHAFTRRIAQERPSRVIQIGTAGSSIFKAGSVVTCTSFIQRDMDATPIGFAPYQTPFSNDPPVLIYGDAVPGFPEACCGSGDNFDESHSKDHPWTVVEMEAYVIALICQRENIPFSCLKYISDGADGQAAALWADALKDAARKLADALKTIPQT